MGEEFRVGSGFRPSVSLDADGGFVVVWYLVSNILGQRYSSNGDAVGAEFQVNTYLPERKLHPSVSMDVNGDFVVVWQSRSSGGTDTSFDSIQGWRFTSEGSAVGEDFQVNTYTTGYQFRPSVSMDADGDFVVVWMSGVVPGQSNYSIQGQRYGSDGSPAGGEFQVNTYTTGAQIFPSVSMDTDGDFVVVWSNYCESPCGPIPGGIRGRRYGSDGFPVGEDFQVNTYTTDFPSLPSMAMDADGDFVVVWQSHNSGGTDTDITGIEGQRYSSVGSPVGGEFQVNTYTTSRQIESSVSVDADGNFVVVWQSDGSGDTDTSDFSIQKADSAPILLVFKDGFETGDLSIWSGLFP